ncbi:hypothetical protein RAG50_26660 [Klebsiella pneumoniae]
MSVEGYRWDSEFQQQQEKDFLQTSLQQAKFNQKKPHLPSASRFAEKTPDLTHICRCHIGGFDA